MLQGTCLSTAWLIKLVRSPATQSSCCRVFSRPCCCSRMRSESGEARASTLACRSLTVRCSCRILCSSLWHCNSSSRWYWWQATEKSLTVTLQEPKTRNLAETQRPLPSTGPWLRGLSAHSPPLGARTQSPNPTHCTSHHTGSGQPLLRDTESYSRDSTVKAHLSRWRTIRPHQAQVK